MASPLQINYLYEFGPFRINRAERILLRDGEIVPTTPKQLDILLLLVENRDHIVEKERLMREIWPDTAVEEANLTTNIYMLRKALGEGTNAQQYIQTLPRRGYRFVGEVKEVATEDSRSVAKEPVELRLVTRRDQENLLPRKGLTRGDWASLGAKWKLALAGLGLLAVTAAVAFYWWSKPKSPATGGAVKTIAVLPFKPLVAESRNESLELGMADTLITKLSGIRNIIVRPVSAVRKYTLLEQDPVAAGRELKVDAVLDGSIQTVDERIRVTVRLTRVADGQPLWVDQFNEKMTDLLAIQESVSAKVTSALALRLTSEDKTSLAKRYTTSTEAYQLYLKGRLFWNKRTEEGMWKAIEYFRQAIEKDPSYALAHSGLADAYSILGQYLDRTDEFDPKALEAATKAVEIDGSLAETHTSLAYALARRNWPGAEVEFKRAIEINPNYSTAHHWYANGLAGSSRSDEGLAEMRWAQELDPTSVIINSSLGNHYYGKRMYDEAIEQLNKALEMDPNFIHALATLGKAYIKKGMREEAIATHRKAVELAGGVNYIKPYLAYVYAVSDLKVEARKILDELLEQSKRSNVSPFDLAIIHVGLGEKDQAFRWFEKSYQDEGLSLGALIAEPLFDPISSDPRFEDLIRRVRLR